MLLGTGAFPPPPLKKKLNGGSKCFEKLSYDKRIFILQMAIRRFDRQYLSNQICIYRPSLFEPCGDKVKCWQ